MKAPDWRGRAADDNPSGCEAVFMGEQIKVIEIAKNLIALSGLILGKIYVSHTPTREESPEEDHCQEFVIIDLLKFEL